MAVGTGGRDMGRIGRATAAGIGLLVALAPARQAEAQSPAGHGGAAPAGRRGTRCRGICAPTVTLMPGVLRTHLAGGPVVRGAAGGTEDRLPGTSAFEVIVAVVAPTAVPRVSLFGSAEWLPNASVQRNPFTLYTADELGSHVRANAPTLTGGISLALLPASAAGGWLDAALNVGDLFSQSARPADRSAYTHKLDLDLVAHAHVFAHAPAGTYLHRASVFGILDYVASGLPRAGDEVPAGRRFVTGARPLAVVVGLALPLTPDRP